MPCSTTTLSPFVEGGSTHLGGDLVMGSRLRCLAANPPRAHISLSSSQSWQFSRHCKGTMTGAMINTGACHGNWTLWEIWDRNVIWWSCEAVACVGSSPTTQVPGSLSWLSEREVLLHPPVFGTRRKRYGWPIAASTKAIVIGNERRKYRSFNSAHVLFPFAVLRLPIRSQSLASRGCCDRTGHRTPEQ